MCTCMCTCMCERVCMRVCVCVNEYGYRYVYMYRCIYVCMCVCIYTYIYIHIYVFVYTYLYRHINTYTLVSANEHPMCVSHASHVRVTCIPWLQRESLSRAGNSYRERFLLCVSTSRAPSNLHCTSALYSSALHCGSQCVIACNHVCHSFVCDMNNSQV